MMTNLPQFPWLSLLVLLPLAGALLCALHRQRPVEARWLALATSLAVFGVSVWLFVCYGDGASADAGGWLLREDAPWIERYGMRYLLQIDGISLLLVMLTTFLQLVSLLLAWRVERNAASFFALLMLLECGLLGIFLAGDLILFYLFWELALVPIFFLIAFWGGANRRAAALKFFLYTLAGSLCMLVAMIALYQIHGDQSGSYSFVISDLMQTQLTAAQEGWLFAGFMAAFIIKAPLPPFHTWLIDAFSESPASGSLDLTGLLLKTGIYGMIRLAFPLFPNATQAFMPLLAALALFGLFYAAWCAYHEDDIKRLLAYSAVSHLGLVVLGLAAWQATAWEGSLLLMLGSGVTTGALFVLAALIQQRTGTRSLSELGGLWGQTPNLGFFFLLFSLASLGLPGLANFAGEILVLLGVFPQQPLWAVIAIVGVVFAAAYMLRLVQGTLWGPVMVRREMLDLDLREWLILTPLALLTLWLGLYPASFLAPMQGAVALLLTGGLP